MKKVVTNDGKKGGWLEGKPHYDKDGKPLGGIKAVVTDAGGKPVELEGGEVIINKEASAKHWKELSRINQSAGNGVAIGPPSGADYDEDPEEYKEGGKVIEFNANHVPNKWILNYAKNIKEKHPEIWKLGGNIFGNQAFINLKRVSERGYWLDSEKWMYIKWRSYVARHKKDFRIEGVVAMLKWVDKVDKGWAYMKDLIEERIDKIKDKKEGKGWKHKMKSGGKTIAQTPAPKKERIYGSKVNKPESAASESKAKSIKLSDAVIESIKNKIKGTGISLATAKAVVRRGMGAYSSSHRPTITGGKPNSRVAWGLARLNAFLYKAEHGKSKSGKYTQDDDLLRESGFNVKKYHLGGDMSKHLAPNGKPSNLTHEQWHLVRTPEFKAWFGDWENDAENASKVIDENGEPLVVYHGTYVENPFYIFDFNKVDLGFHFGTYEQAKNRSETKLFFKGRKSIVNSFFLNVKNLFETSDIGEWEYPQRYIDMFVSDGLINESDAKKNGFYRLIQREENKKIREYLLNKYGKFVGFVYNNKYEGKGKSFIVLNPNQIKLADGTNTTFDGGNPDIRYADGGKVPFNIHREFNEYSDKLPEFGYHGTQSETLINPRPSKDGRYGEGFYLTLDPDTAEYFGRFTKTSLGYSKENESANVFEFDLRGLNLKYYKRAEDMPYIDFEELNKKNYDGIYLYNEGEIVIFNIDKLQDGKLIRSKNEIAFNRNNPDIRYADGGIVDIAEWEKKEPELFECLLTIRELVEANAVVKDSFIDTHNNIYVIKYEDSNPYFDSIITETCKTLTDCEDYLEVGQVEVTDKFVLVPLVKNTDRRYAGGGELAKGIKTEQEHRKTLEKIASGKLSVDQAIERTAKDHLKEDPNYYTKLLKMEGKMANGGGVSQTSYKLNTPTGEPTKLTYMQQVLVRTQTFKKWFGDWESAAKMFIADNKENFKKHYKGVSKVLDMTTLEPRVVFHGTRSEEEFFMFDVSKEKGIGRPYAYFAHNIEYSRNFTQFSQRGHQRSRGFLYQCFLNIKNPFMAMGQQYEMKNRKAESWKDIITGTIAWDKYGAVTKDPKTENLELAVDAQISLYLNKAAQSADVPFWNFMARDSNSDFKYFLVSYGYDGIFYTEEFANNFDPTNPAQYTKAVTVFNPSDIKLADGRNLDFNPMEADIRMEEGGEVEQTPANTTNKKEQLGNLLFGDKYANGGSVDGIDKIITQAPKQELSKERKFVDELIKKMKNGI